MVSGHKQVVELASRSVSTNFSSHIKENETKRCEKRWQDLFVFLSEDTTVPLNFSYL